MLHRNPAQTVAAILFCVPFVAYPLWSLFDRAPPYVRESGTIEPAPPQECGLGPDDPTRGAVSPGACVFVDWKIRVLRSCPPDRPDNLTRKIRDSEGVVHTVGPVRGQFGTTPGEPPETIRRYWIVPSSAKPGPSLYESSTTYACNPFQRYLPRLFWPIVVDTPSIPFTIQPGRDQRSHRFWDQKRL